MKTIRLTRKDIHRGPLILVNRQYAVQDNGSDDAEDLLAVDDNRLIYMASRAGVMLSQLMKACRAEDEIIPVSGYRSFREQKEIFDDSIEENGKEFTLKYVAFPGCSEHQTGLAVDVARQSDVIDPICPDFPYSGVCQEFRLKAPGYGFIERYQKGKERITGISQEPWHFRYVGYPHSEIIEKNGLTLEEYISYLRSHRHSDGSPLLFRGKGRAIEISYLALGEKSDILLPVADDCFQVSGNNVDGIILTIWREQA